MVEKYRKKPVEVEAVLFTRETFDEIVQFTDGKANDLRIPRCPEGKAMCVIPTLEGNHIAREGDYIIKGVHGEFYPCKPDIFAKTYEDVIIDPESLRPKGECKYCSKEDNGALCWDCSDLGISIEYRAGRIRVTNEYGDEAYLGVNFCPNCGADMKGG